MLRFLQGLVVVLTLSLIVGLITVVAVIVTRFPRPHTVTAPLPDSITLPAGVTARAVTQGTDWYAIVTGDDRILIFDRRSGALRQTVDIVSAD